MDSLAEISYLANEESVIEDNRSMLDTIDENDDESKDQPVSTYINLFNYE